MRIDKICLMGLIAAVAMFGSTNVIAVAPPPPQGVPLAPNMAWCPRCGGWGRVPSGFLGWKDKRCPECRGRGMVYPAWYKPPAPVVVPAPAPVVAPPPAKHHHHEVKPLPPAPKTKHHDRHSEPKGHRDDHHSDRRGPGPR